MGFLGPLSSRQRIDAGATSTMFGLPRVGEPPVPPDTPPVEKRYMIPDPKFQQPLTLTTLRTPIAYKEQTIRREATGINTARQGEFIAVRRQGKLVLMKQPAGNIFEQVGRIPIR